MFDSLSQDYDYENGYYVLKEVPDEYRSKILGQIETKGVTCIKLKLTSGHSFSYPLAMKKGIFLTSLKAKFRSRILKFGKRVYYIIGPVFARIGLLPQLRLYAARMTSERSSDSVSDSGFFVDDLLFEKIGQTLILKDDNFSAPSTLGLSLTNRCNLSCVMCPYHGPDEKAKHIDNYFDEKHLISAEQFERVVSYCASNNISLQLGQQDEPLLLLLKEKYHEVIRRYQPIMSITTNGTLLRTEEEWKKITNLPRLHHISISIDAATANTYLKIRGGDLDELQKQLIDFFNYLKRNRPEVKRRVCFVQQPLNLGEEDIFIDFWKAHVHQISIYQMTEYSDGALSYSPNYSAEKRTPCNAIFSTMYVQPDGDILPCCLFMYNAPYEGRYPVTKFSEDAWHSDKYHHLRSSVTSENFGPVCDKCTIWKQGIAHETVERGMRVTVNPYEKHYYVI